MKLYYYKDELGNFGDDLNPWLWDKLLPGFFDGNEKDWMIGIGTLLNHKLPVAGRKHVFGSGYGYGSKPKLDDSYNFLCVRGPLTAEALNLPKHLAITDSAILIKSVEVPKVNKIYKFGFIPHHTSIRNFSWDKLCSRLGYNFINPEWSVDKVLSELSKCEIVMCEAMHGAIVCDALRIPWIPLKAYSYISDFKWQDWLLTLDIPYKPIAVPSLYDAESRLTFSEKQKNSIKRTLASVGLSSKSWAAPHPQSSSQTLVDEAYKDFLSASTSEAYLSDDALCSSLLNQYLEKLENLKVIRAQV
ncbi:MAG: polysaccharide pyruvyl transferase family protein [Pseudomonadota bacterium]